MSEGITWETESAKLFSGDDHQKGCAAMIRAFEAELTSMATNIAAGKDPQQQIAGARQWLAMCLYSANMNNFNSKGQPL